MSTLLMKDKLQHEINLIPEHKLTELFSVVHYFRLEVESLEKINQSSETSKQAIASIRNNPAFGMWQDLESDTSEILQQIRQQQWS